MATWTAFPHASKSYDYTPAQLIKQWSRLHAGDQEPFPDAARVAVLLGSAKALQKQ